MKMPPEHFGFVHNIAPFIRPYVQDLYQDLKLGLCKSKIDFERISGMAEESQFRLILPYCSKKLRWEVVFDDSKPWFGPDFRFDDETFLSDAEPEFIEKNLPSLANWDENNPKALTEVISQLVSLYRSHQISKLNEDENSRAYFEYTALLGDSVTSETEVEVFVGGHTVEFLIKLNVDVASLPQLYSGRVDENPGLDGALLLVRYGASRGSHAELMMSPLLSTALGDVTLPTMHQSGVLMDYVPMVTEMINKKIRGVLINNRLKRELLSQMVVKYEGAVLEQDDDTATFLFEIDDFHWILHVNIESDFPEKPPTLVLRSVYHCSRGKPKTKALQSCPYNDFENFIEQQVEIFKNECQGVHNSVISLDT